MNSHPQTVIVAAALLGVLSPAFAQDPTDLAAQRDQRVNLTTTTTASDPDWFNKTINVDIKNASLVDAVKKVLDAAKVEYTKVDAEDGLPNLKLSLTIKEVNARDALAAVARLGGAQAYVTTQNDKTVIELRKRNAIAESRVFTFGSGSAPFSSTLTMPSFAGQLNRWANLPNKQVTLEAKDVSADELIKRLERAGGIDCDLERDSESKGKYSLELQKVPLGQAVDAVAGMLNCGYQVEKTGDKVKVTFGRRFTRPIPFGTFNSGQTFAPTFPGAASMPGFARLPGATSRAAEAISVARSAMLPDKRVSLDQKNADPRELLKDVLKQAGLDYALADDLPSEPKSFTFSNVLIRTALDMLCESMGVGWRAEGSGEGKVTIRIAKRYARTSSRNGATQNLFRRDSNEPAPTPSR